MEPLTGIVNNNDFVEATQSFFKTGDAALALLSGALRTCWCKEYQTAFFVWFSVSVFRIAGRASISRAFGAFLSLEMQLVQHTKQSEESEDFLLTCLFSFAAHTDSFPALGKKLLPQHDAPEGFVSRWKTKTSAVKWTLKLLTCKSVTSSCPALKYCLMRLLCTACFSTAHLHCISSSVILTLKYIINISSLPTQLVL